MAKVTASTDRVITAPVDTVRAIVADYAQGRPRILPEQYRDYQVVEGGTGAGTVVKWKLQATSKRVRDVAATVSEPEPGTLVETDANSSMVTTWKVRADGDATAVSIETSWDGAGGIGGFFERTFAPAGLKRIYDAMLDKLDGEAGKR